LSKLVVKNQTASFLLKQAAKAVKLAISNKQLLKISLLIIVIIS